MVRAASAQQVKKVHRVAFVNPTAFSDIRNIPLIRIFIEELQGLGYAIDSCFATTGVTDLYLT